MGNLEIHIIYISLSINHPQIATNILHLFTSSNVLLFGRAVETAALRLEIVLQGVAYDNLPVHHFGSHLACLRSKQLGATIEP